MKNRAQKNSRDRAVSIQIRVNVNYYGEKKFHENHYFIREMKGGED